MSVTVMTFRAGSNAYALAAGCVEGVGPERMEAPHLLWALRGHLPEFVGGRRTLHVVAGGRRTMVTVDGPIELVELESVDIAPCRTTTSSMIMGFARADGANVIALLDADRLVEIVHQAATGTVSEI
jgi:hypothetical protein